MDQTLDELKQQNKFLQEKVWHYEETLMRLNLLVLEKLGSDEISKLGIKRITEFSDKAMEFGEKIGVDDKGDNS